MMAAQPMYIQILTCVLVTSALHLAVCWECPAPKEVRDNKCWRDSDCVDNAKCCAFDSEYSCWKLVEFQRDLLNCPARTGLSPTSCYDTCHSDSECIGGRICCLTDCGRTCYPPIKHEKIKSVMCPAHTDPRNFHCDYPCSTDDDCTSMGRCCNFACGRSCWWTPVEAFMTATVMGECDAEQTASVGERDVRLSCELLVNSSRSMHVTWHKGDAVVPHENGRVMTEENCMDRECRRIMTHLVFKNIMPQDEGKYTMIVTSGLEKYGHTVHLTMYNKPHIEITPRLITVSSGGDAAFTCRIVNLQSANPYYGKGIKLKWCHRGLSNADYQGIHTHRDGLETLTLKDVSGDVTIGCGLNSTDCTVTADVKVLSNDNNGCPRSVDIRNYQWPWTPAQETRVGPCPERYSGRSTRTCSHMSTWFYPNYYKCVSERIRYIDREIHNQLAQHRRGQLREATIHPVLFQLDTATMELNLTGGDIDGIVESISDIIILVKVTKKKLGGTGTESVINIIGNTLATKNLDEWKIILKETLSPATVRSILRSVNQLGIMTADDQLLNDDPVTLVRETILFGAGKTEPEDLTFPGKSKEKESRQKRSTQGDSSSSSSSVFIEKETLRRLLEEPTVRELKWTYAIYRTLADILNVADDTSNARSLAFTDDGKLTVVSEIVSVVVDSPNDAVLQPPITAHMRILLDGEEEQQFFDNYVQRTCGRFTSLSGTNASHWTSEGCILTINGTDVICQCNRFGHIAVLAMMREPSGPLLMLALKICCAIPLLGALIIAIVNVRRGCCAAGSLLSLNVSVAMALGYALFAGTIDLTANQVFCSKMAVVLHYLFTVSVLTVLGQTVHLVISYRHAADYGTPPSSKWPRLVLMVSAWVVAGVVVAATVGIRGVPSYGSEHLCWINTNYGSAFALIIPVAVVLLIHLCIFVYCVCAGRTYYDIGTSEEKMGMKSGYTISKYRDEDIQQACRKNVILKQSLRSVYLLLDLVAAILLVMMTSQVMDDHILEYLFVAFTACKTIILVYVDAYLEEIDNQPDNNSNVVTVKVKDNIYEDVLDAK